MRGLCVVISALNEAPRLPAVLAPLAAVPEVERITVVDDGSRDGTAAVAREWEARDPRIRVLRLRENRGKGAAIAAGAEASPGDLVVLLDADLLGLEAQHVRDLALPVAEGRCAMTVGIFREGRLATDLSQALTPILNGQRALRWSLFRDTPGLSASRGGAEVALSRHARGRGYRVLRVPLRGMTHVMKQEKGPRLAGRLAHLRMFREILQYLLRKVRA
jgi:GT2 family glycosyltransferase